MAVFKTRPHLLAPDQPAGSLGKATGSLTRQTLIQIAASVTAVIVTSTAVSYWQVRSSLKAQTLEQLKSYVVERGQRENSIFTLAEDNHALLKQELLQRLQTSNSADPTARFDQLLARSPDGVIRNRPNIFDGKRQPGVYIDKSLAVTPEIRRRVLTFYDLLSTFGPAWHNRFQDTYITTPENIMVVYWPEVPTWAQDASADLYMPNEEYVWVADLKNNPSRKSAWTGLFYDTVGKTWMVSCATPVDLNGRQIATIGHDILLNELLQRTVDDRITGGYNLIFRSDGRLIAHPELMEEIQEQKGAFNISNSGDAQLKAIFDSVKNKSANQIIIDNPEMSEYLAVTQMKGPDWYFVTVLPKSVLAAQVASIAQLTLLLGLGSLVIVIGIIFLILRRRIAVPLERITSATHQMAAGNFQVVLDDSRQDELGRLAQAFNTMAQKVVAQTTELQKTLEQQSISVNQTTATMDELNVSARLSAEQAEAAATGARQVLSLIDGRANEYAFETTHSTSSLRDKVGQMAQQILNLSDQINQISVVSSAVSDLASQTNMLALNAAVEAARAGENGRGFAVVAAEIRKLADQSRRSAEKINGLVQDIQKATNTTVMVSDEGSKTVDEIVRAINTITLNSQKISLTAQQQAIAVQQVVDAMKDLSQQTVPMSFH